MPEKWFWVETEAGYLSIQRGAGTSATEIILNEEIIFREETILDESASRLNFLYARNSLYVKERIFPEGVTHPFPFSVQNFKNIEKEWRY